MKETWQEKQIGSLRKVYHCKNCGRIQSYTNFECESCGIDLGLYGKVELVESTDFCDSAEEHSKAEERRHREEDAKSRADAEKERRRLERLKQEEAKRKAEEERRQIQLRKEAESKAKAERERLWEEQRLKAEEERRQLQRQQERENAEIVRRKPHKPSKKRLNPESEQDAVSKFTSRLFRTIRTTVIISVALAVFFMFIGFNAHSCGEDLRWDFDEDTATLTIEGSGAMYSYTSAPEGGLGAVQLPDLDVPPWMEKYGQKIQHVVIGEDVSSIGSYAFAGCHNLESIYLGENVERIEQCAFYNTSLESFIIPENVSEIERNAFAGNDELRNVFINGNPQMHSDVFTWNDRLILFANGTSDVDEYAQGLDLIFVDSADTWNEEEIVGEEDVYKRLNHFFGGQSDDGKLQWKINIDTRLMTLTGSGPMEDFNGKWILAEAENMEAWVEGRNFPYWTDYSRIIEELVIEEGITRIGDSAFEQCYHLQKATLPNTVEYIGFQSFLCAGLVRISIPEGVTEIRDHAFNFCEHLQFAELPESLQRLQNGTFNMCNVLHSLKIGENTEVERRTGKNGCYSIFSNDDNPDGKPDRLVILGKYGSDAHKFAQEENYKFRGTGLKAGTKDSGKCGDNVWWTFEGDERTLYITGQGSTWSYFITQKDIDDWAGDLYRRNQIREGTPEFLAYATYIEHIVVQNGVTVLGHGLFSSHDDPLLRNLKTVDFGSVRHIQANLKQTQLEYVEFPASVTGIDGCALADNDHLKTVVIRNGGEWIGIGLLYNCNGLERVELHGKEKIEDYNNGDIFNAPGDLPKWYLPSYLRLYVTHNSDGEQMAREKSIPYEYLD